MTHPTKAIYYSLLKDLAKASKNSSEEALYNEEDLDASMEQIEVVDFYSTIEVAGLKVGRGWCMHAPEARMAWASCSSGSSTAWRGACSVHACVQCTRRNGHFHCTPQV